MVAVVGVVIILVMAGRVLKSEPLLVRGGYACPSFLWLRIVVVAFGIVVLWCCLLSHPSFRAIRCILSNGP
jgi:hypothetical protein